MLLPVTVLRVVVRVLNAAQSYRQLSDVVHVNATLRSPSLTSPEPAGIWQSV